MQTAAIWEYKGTTMRSSRIEDKDAYYINGFTECDREIARMTGSKMHYSKEEVDAYFVSCLSDTTRYDFLLFDSQDSLIGECVISESAFFKAKIADRESAAGRCRRSEISPFAS